MGKEIRIAVLAGITIALLLMGVIWVVFNSAQTHAPELAVRMLGDQNCVSPCFFGQSLHGKSFDEVGDIISREEIMKDVALRHQTQVNEQLISWKWPDALKVRLTSEGLNMDQYFLFPDEDLNYIWFRDGELVSAQFVFLIRLDELIALRGEPEIVSVGIYTTSVQGLMLRYDDSSVYFEGHFLCRMDRLYPYTRIWAYHYTSTPYDTTLNPTVRWTGIDTTQPSCDFPPP